jgi:hypothetical protein
VDDQEQVDVMQVIGTEVAAATIANGEPATRVTFRGEGGERVVVETGGERPDDLTAIEKAKAILVQTAVFGEPGLRADNDSRPLGALGSGHEGQSFVLEYRDGETSRRVPPSLLPGLDAAREEAIRSAIDLLGDVDPQLPPAVWLARVYDETGALIATITKGEAEEAAKAARFEP